MTTSVTTSLAFATLLIIYTRCEPDTPNSSKTSQGVINPPIIHGRSRRSPVLSYIPGIFGKSLSSEESPTASVTESYPSYTLSPDYARGEISASAWMPSYDEYEFDNDTIVKYTMNPLKKDWMDWRSDVSEIPFLSTQPDSEFVSLPPAMENWRAQLNELATVRESFEEEDSNLVASDWKEIVYKTVRDRWKNEKVNFSIIKPVNFVETYGNNDTSRSSKFQKLRKLLRKKLRVLLSEKFNVTEFSENVRQIKSEELSGLTKENLEMLYIFAYVDQPNFYKFESYYKQLFVSLQSNWRETVLQIIISRYSDRIYENVTIVVPQPLDLRASGMTYFHDSKTLEKMQILFLLQKQSWVVTQQDKFEISQYYRKLFSDVALQSKLEGFASRDIEMFFVWIHQNATLDFELFYEFYNNVVKTVRVQWKKQTFAFVHELYANRTDIDIHEPANWNSNKTVAMSSHTLFLEMIRQHLRLRWKQSSGIWAIGIDEFRTILRQDTHLRQVFNANLWDFEILFIYVVQDFNEDYCAFRSFINEITGVVEWKRVVYTIAKQMYAGDKRVVLKEPASFADSSAAPEGNVTEKHSKYVYLRDLIRRTVNGTRYLYEKAKDNVEVLRLTKEWSFQDIFILTIWVEQKVTNDFVQFATFINEIVMFLEVVEDWRKVIYEKLKTVNDPFIELLEFKIEYGGNLSNPTRDWAIERIKKDFKEDSSNMDELRSNDAVVNASIEHAIPLELLAVWLKQSVVTKFSYFYQFVLNVVRIRDSLDKWRESVYKLMKYSLGILNMKKFENVIENGHVNVTREEQYDKLRGNLRRSLGIRESDSVTMYNLCLKELNDTKVCVWVVQDFVRNYSKFEIFYNALFESRQPEIEVSNVNEQEKVFLAGASQESLLNLSWRNRSREIPPKDSTHRRSVMKLGNVVRMQFSAEADSSSDSTEATTTKPVYRKVVTTGKHFGSMRVWIPGTLLPPGFKNRKSQNNASQVYPDGITTTKPVPATISPNDATSTNKMVETLVDVKPNASEPGPRKSKLIFIMKKRNTSSSVVEENSVYETSRPNVSSTKPVSTQPVDVTSTVTPLYPNSTPTTTLSTQNPQEVSPLVTTKMETTPSPQFTHDINDTVKRVNSSIAFALKELIPIQMSGYEYPLNSTTTRSQSLPEAVPSTTTMRVPVQESLIESASLTAAPLSTTSASTFTTVIPTSTKRLRLVPGASASVEIVYLYEDEEGNTTRKTPPTMAAAISTKTNLPNMTTSGKGLKMPWETGSIEVMATNDDINSSTTGSTRSSTPSNVSMKDLSKILIESVLPATTLKLPVSVAPDKELGPVEDDQDPKNYTLVPKSMNTTNSDAFNTKNIISTTTATDTPSASGQKPINEIEVIDSTKNATINNATNIVQLPIVSETQIQNDTMSVQFNGNVSVPISSLVNLDDQSGLNMVETTTNLPSKFPLTIFPAMKLDTDSKGSTPVSATTTDYGSTTTNNTTVQTLTEGVLSTSGTESKKGKKVKFVILKRSKNNGTVSNAGETDTPVFQEPISANMTTTSRSVGSTTDGLTPLNFALGLLSPPESTTTQMSSSVQNATRMLAPTEGNYSISEVGPSDNTTLYTPPPEILNSKTRKYKVLKVYRSKTTPAGITKTTIPSITQSTTEAPLSYSPTIQSSSNQATTTQSNPSPTQPPPTQPLLNQVATFEAPQTPPVISQGPPTQPPVNQVAPNQASPNQALLTQLHPTEASPTSSASGMPLLTTRFYSSVDTQSTKASSTTPVPTPDSATQTKTSHTTELSTSTSPNMKIFACSNSNMSIATNSTFKFPVGVSEDAMENVIHVVADQILKVLHGESVKLADIGDKLTKHILEPYHYDSTVDDDESSWPINSHKLRVLINVLQQVVLRLPETLCQKYVSTVQEMVEAVDEAIIPPTTKSPTSTTQKIKRPVIPVRKLSTGRPDSNMSKSTPATAPGGPQFVEFSKSFKGNPQQENFHIKSFTSIPDGGIGQLDYIPHDMGTVNFKHPVHNDSNLPSTRFRHSNKFPKKSKKEIWRPRSLLNDEPEIQIQAVSSEENGTYSTLASTFTDKMQPEELDTITGQTTASPNISIFAKDDDVAISSTIATVSNPAPHVTNDNSVTLKEMPIRLSTIDAGVNKNDGPQVATTTPVNQETQNLKNKDLSPNIDTGPTSGIDAVDLFLSTPQARKIGKAVSLIAEPGSDLIVERILSTPPAETLYTNSSTTISRTNEAQPQRTNEITKSAVSINHTPELQEASITLVNDYIPLPTAGAAATESGGIHQEASTIPIVETEFLRSDKPLYENVMEPIPGLNGSTSTTRKPNKDVNDILSKLNQLLRKKPNSTSTNELKPNELSIVSGVQPKGALRSFTSIVSQTNLRNPVSSPGKGNVTIAQTTEREIGNSTIVDAKLLATVVPITTEMPIIIVGSTPPNGAIKNALDDSASSPSTLNISNDTNTLAPQPIEDESSQRTMMLRNSTMLPSHLAANTDRNTSNYASELAQVELLNTPTVSVFTDSSLGKSTPMTENTELPDIIDGEPMHFDEDTTPPLEVGIEAQEGIVKSTTTKPSNERETHSTILYGNGTVNSGLPKDNNITPYTYPSLKIEQHFVVTTTSEKGGQDFVANSEPTTAIRNEGQNPKENNKTNNTRSVTTNKITAGVSEPTGSFSIIESAVDILMPTIVDAVTPTSAPSSTGSSSDLYFSTEKFQNETNNLSTMQYSDAETRRISHGKVYHSGSHEKQETHEVIENDIKLEEYAVFNLTSTLAPELPSGKPDDTYIDVYVPKHRSILKYHHQPATTVSNELRTKRNRGRKRTHQGHHRTFYKYAPHSGKWFPSSSRPRSTQAPAPGIISQAPSENVSMETDTEVFDHMSREEIGTKPNLSEIEIPVEMLGLLISAIGNSIPILLRGQHVNLTSIQEPIFSILKRTIIYKNASESVNALAQLLTVASAKYNQTCGINSLKNHTGVGVPNTDKTEVSFTTEKLETHAFVENDKNVTNGNETRNASLGGESLGEQNMGTSWSLLLPKPRLKAKFSGMLRSNVGAFPKPQIPKNSDVFEKASEVSAINENSSTETTRLVSSYTTKKPEMFSTLEPTTLEPFSNTQLFENPDISIKTRNNYTINEDLSIKTKNLVESNTSSINAETLTTLATTTVESLAATQLPEISDIPLTDIAPVNENWSNKTKNLVESNTSRNADTLTTLATTTVEPFAATQLPETPDILIAANDIAPVTENSYNKTKNFVEPSTSMKAETIFPTTTLDALPNTQFPGIPDIPKGSAEIFPVTTRNVAESNSTEKSNLSTILPALTFEQLSNTWSTENPSISINADQSYKEWTTEQEKIEIAKPPMSSTLEPIPSTQVMEQIKTSNKTVEITATEGNLLSNSAPLYLFVVEIADDELPEHIHVIVDLIGRLMHKEPISLPKENPKVSRFILSNIPEIYSPLNRMHSLKSLLQLLKSLVHRLPKHLAEEYETVLSSISASVDDDAAHPKTQLVKIPKSRVLKTIKILIDLIYSRISNKPFDIDKTNEDNSIKDLISQYSSLENHQLLSIIKSYASEHPDISLPPEYDTVTLLVEKTTLMVPAPILPDFIEGLIKLIQSKISGQVFTLSNPSRADALLYDYNQLETHILIALVNYYARKLPENAERRYEAQLREVQDHYISALPQNYLLELVWHVVHVVEYWIQYNVLLYEFVSFPVEAALEKYDLTNLNQLTVKSLLHFVTGLITRLPSNVQNDVRKNVSIIEVYVKKFSRKRDYGETIEVDYEVVEESTAMPMVATEHVPKLLHAVLAILEKLLKHEKIDFETIDQRVKVVLKTFDITQALHKRVKLKVLIDLLDYLKTLANQLSVEAANGYTKTINEIMESIGDDPHAEFTFVSQEASSEETKTTTVRSTTSVRTNQIRRRVTRKVLRKSGNNRSRDGDLAETAPLEETGNNSASINVTAYIVTMDGTDSNGPLNDSSLVPQNATYEYNTVGNDHGNTMILNETISDRNGGIKIEKYLVVDNFTQWDNGTKLPSGVQRNAYGRSWYSENSYVEKTDGEGGYLPKNDHYVVDDMNRQGAISYAYNGSGGSPTFIESYKTTSGSLGSNTDVNGGMKTSEYFANTNQDGMVMNSRMPGQYANQAQSGFMMSSNRGVGQNIAGGPSGVWGQGNTPLQFVQNPIIHARPPGGIPLIRGSHLVQQSVPIVSQTTYYSPTWVQQMQPYPSSRVSTYSQGGSLFPRGLLGQNAAPLYDSKPSGTFPFSHPGPQRLPGMNHYFPGPIRPQYLQQNSNPGGVIFNSYSLPQNIQSPQTEGRLDEAINSKISPAQLEKASSPQVQALNNTGPQAIADSVIIAKNSTQSSLLSKQVSGNKTTGKGEHRQFLVRRYKPIGNASKETRSSKNGTKINNSKLILKDSSQLPQNLASPSNSSASTKKLQTSNTLRITGAPPFTTTRLNSALNHFRNLEQEGVNSVLDDDPPSKKRKPKKKQTPDLNVVFAADEAKTEKANIQFVSGETGNGTRDKLNVVFGSSGESEEVVIISSDEAREKGMLLETSGESLAIPSTKKPFNFGEMLLTPRPRTNNFPFLLRANAIPFRRRRKRSLRIDARHLPRRHRHRRRLRTL